MIRRLVLSALLAVVWNASSATSVQSATRQLKKCTTSICRIEWQDSLFYLHDTKAIKYIRATAILPLNTQERFANSAQAVRYFLLVEKQLDSASAHLQLLKNGISNHPARRLKFDLLNAEYVWKSGEKAKALNMASVYRNHFSPDSIEASRAHEYLMYWITLSRYYRQLNKIDSAAVFAHYAFSNRELTSNRVLRYRAVWELSRVYHALGQNDMALKRIGETNNAVHNLAIPFDVAYYHYYVAKYLLNLYEYGSANEHLHKCIQWAQKHDIGEFLGSGYVNISVALHGMDSLDKSLSYLKKAKRWYIKEQPTKTDRVFSVMLNLANIYRDAGAYDSAIWYYRKAEAYGRQQRLNNRQGVLYNNVARLYLQKRELDSSLLYASLANEVLGPKDYYQRVLLQETLEHVHVAGKRYKQALEAHRVSDSLRSILVGYEEANMVVYHRIELEQEEYKKHLLQTELNLMEEQGRRRRWIFGFLSLFILGGIVVVIIFSLTRHKGRERQVEVLVLKEHYAKSQLEALRSQINPHFIFNSLNTFQYLVRKNESQKALDYLEVFSGLLRDKVFTSGQEFISLRSETELLEKYIEIEKMRIGEQLSFEVKVEPGVNIDRIGIPPIMIQPLLENAIWHGVGSEKDGRVSISFGLDNKLTVTITDNGVGYEHVSGRKIKDKSFGINNIEKRLENLSALYHTTATLEIKKNNIPGERGTIQILTLPKIEI